MQILKADILRIIAMISEAKVIAMAKLCAKGYVNKMHADTIESANSILDDFTHIPHSKSSNNHYEVDREFVERLILSQQFLDSTAYFENADSRDFYKPFDKLSKYLG